VSVLDDGEVTRLLDGVAAADLDAAHAWPGVPATRQPVQVLYVPADRIRAGTCRDVGTEALRLLERHAPDGPMLAAACGLDVDGALADRVHDRVATKLLTEPVEDLRCDVEDGYLGRSAEQEALDVAAAAAGLAHGFVDGWTSPFLGIRVKSFTDGLARRSVASLDRFIGTFTDVAGALPDGFVVTFPKIVAVQHVEAFVGVLSALEAAYGFPAGWLKFEAQIETTASVLGPDGRVALRDIRDAGAGRLCAAHVGVYDYSAGLGLPPREQRLDHPALDLARHLLQVTFAGTEVRLSDGSTATKPADDSTAELHRVWGRHAADVRHSLRHGYVQGWDLHPAHLVSRYAAVYAEVLRDLDDAFDRLHAWDAGDTSGGVMDEPATVRVLEAAVQRAVDCGATDTEEVRARTGREVTPRPVASGPSTR
jgi:citrate lyase beta subunit